MSSQQQLRQIVIEALAEVAPEVDAGSLEADVELVEQLDIDSMDFLAIIVSIHNRTGIEIPERDYPKLATLDAAVSYLESREAQATHA